MKVSWIAGVVLVLVAAAVATALVLNKPSAAPDVNPAAALNGNELDACGDAGGAGETIEPTPESLAASRLAELDNPADRKEHLTWVAKQHWARSNLPLLRTTIVSDPDESVQITAVETALTLAEKEGGNATSGVVQTTLASTKGNTRARGLKAAREHPDAELVPTLIELVDNNDTYATMALNALAYTDSTEAHAKILAVAKDEHASPKLRERAVALLAVTRDPDAYQFLVDLSNGDDETLRRIAGEVLRVMGEG
ncbi:MAG: HEAT repeat domain-containing protein [Planctomycetes bacterium]|nr:HEAT repeat domain-containing protein [Planctomycetota bacterium]